MMHAQITLLVEDRSQPALKIFCIRSFFSMLIRHKMVAISLRILVKNQELKKNVSVYIILKNGCQV